MKKVGRKKRKKRKKNFHCFVLGGEVVASQCDKK
jgi:hypothetical protein